MRRGKHRATSRLALVAVVAALGALGWSGPAGAVAESQGDQLATRIATVINVVRADRGLRRLSTSNRLTRAARAHAASMGQKGFFSHSSAGGASFGHRLQSYYGSTTVGEVLYWQQGIASAREVVAAWLSSAPHRASLLVRRWREIGVATVFVRNAPGVFRGRDVTLVVADFGARR